MKTIAQLTKNMLAHEFEARIDQTAFNDLLNYIILPELDKNIETYNFKNKSLDPIKASILIARIFKASELLQQCFIDAMIICRDNEQAILYLLNFNLIDDFPSTAIQEALPSLIEAKNRWSSFVLHNNQLTLSIYETFRSIE